ncbi:uncharacterized protein LOC114398568 [Glycine soja]|uniref:uncharacterized mitochondrial protein AtMg00810-like n=1 Tax=Glycine max TaxID=3847 RepID=UPI0003DE8FA2|nr:uncharacterized mitochondrial protein AtMg00810-like [Glycine max]XP_028216553.1 uncharacterized protein LOC114398568 [Glycine soja]|eukprot:XP_025982825.1 uncharacterized protein LOC102665006 [Glycine max]
MANQGEPYSNSERYRRLIGKLNYLTITRLDISFAVQFMQAPHVDDWKFVIRILEFIKKALGQGFLYEDKGNTQIFGYCDGDWAGCPIGRKSTTGYCVFIRGNIISWKSKKQDIVAQSNAFAEYRAMAITTCELVWIKQLLQELQFCEVKQMKLYCDNDSSSHCFRSYVS